MQVEGIYRINGNQADIGLIEQKVEESECSSSVIQIFCFYNMFSDSKTEWRFSSCVPDPHVELAELGVGVHAVTGAFKSFLKLLPEPVIPGLYQNAFQDAMSKLLNCLLVSDFDIPCLCLIKLFCGHTFILC